MPTYLYTSRAETGPLPQMGNFCVCFWLRFRVQFLEVQGLHFQCLLRMSDSAIIKSKQGNQKLQIRCDFPYGPSYDSNWTSLFNVSAWRDIPFLNAYVAHQQNSQGWVWQNLFEFHFMLLLVTKYKSQNFLSSPKSCYWSPWAPA